MRSIQRLSELVKEVLAYLNIPIAQEKTEGPLTCLTFLELELDSGEMDVRIPNDKIIDITSQITNILGRKKCTLRKRKALSVH